MLKQQQLVSSTYDKDHKLICLEILKATLLKDQRHHQVIMETSEHFSPRQ